MDISVFMVYCSRIGRKQKYLLEFEYNLQLIERIKSLDKEDRSWNPDMKYWELTVKGLFLLIKSYKKSEKIFFNFGTKEKRSVFLELVEKMKKQEKENKEKEENIIKEKKEWVEYKNYLEKNYNKYSEKLHSLLKPGVKLYPHQVVASLFVDKVRRVLISHEMGLGKTLVSILFVEMNDFKKVVVITPNSLKFNYYNEVEKFTESKAHIVNWKKNKYSIEESKYIILNYEFFNSADKKIADNKWSKLKTDKIDVFISDECQRLKNSKSNTYKNIRRIFSDKIFRDVPNKLFLSGTPAPNRAYELYNVLNQISPIEFKRKNDFYEYYCGMYYDYWSGWGYVTNTENQKLDELYEKISPYTHRKRKNEVLKDLPDKTFQKISLEMSEKQTKEYNLIEKATADNVFPDPKPHHLSILMDLRKYLSKIKKEEIIDVVEDIINTGEKVVIVDFFKEPLRDLHKRFGDISVLHTGDQTIEEREEAIQQFQDLNSKVKIFLGSTDVTKEGLTLTAASKLFLLTLPFVPGVYDQISDRLHRIGQKKAVNIYIPVFLNTIDIFNTLVLIDDKKTELSVVMDNEKYVNKMQTNKLKNVFNYLIEKYDKKK